MAKDDKPPAASKPENGSVWREVGGVREFLINGTRAENVSARARNGTRGPFGKINEKLSIKSFTDGSLVLLRAADKTT